MTPELALKIAEASEAAFKRDYLVASVLVLLAVNGAWAYAMRAMVTKLSEVQDKRVSDSDTRAAKLESLAERLTAHVIRNTETNVVLMRMVEELRPRRRPPALGIEPTSAVRPSLATGEK